MLIDRDYLRFRFTDNDRVAKDRTSPRKPFRTKTTLLLAFTLFLWTLLPAAAQTTSGSILGTVTDPSGAGLPGATVTLINNGTQEKRTIPSNSSGDYTFVNVVPGTYEVDFEQTGFQTFKRQNVPVTVTATVRIDGKLQVGNVSEVISVNTAPPVLDTAPGALGQLIEGKQVQEMPLNGRNVFNLLILAPGVVPQGSTGGNPLGNQANGTYTNNTGFGNYQIGGGMANESAFFLDGTALNTTYINSPALVPTQDAIQEFRVDTNAVSAEFGRFAGGVINMASRSGTNDFHGSVYEYIRNRALNSNTYFNKHNPASIVPTPAFTQNQYGVTVGGPLRKDRIFGFFSWEGFALRRGNPLLTTVPSGAFKAGDFSALCSSYTSAGVCNAAAGSQLYDPFSTCGITGAPACPSGRSAGRLPFARNQIPLSRLDVASMQFQTLYGTPNRTATINGTNGQPTNNFATNVSLGGSTNQFNGRLDWVVSDKQRIFGRYTYWAGTSLPSDPFHVNFGGLNSYTGSQNFVLGDTYTFNPRTVGDFRISYLRSTNGFTPQQVGYNVSLFGPAYASLAPQLTLNVPPLASNGYTGFSGTDNRSIVNNYIASGSITKIVGRHSLKFGGEMRHNGWNFAQSNQAGGTFTFDQGFTAQLTPAGSQVANTGYAGASFFLGTPASGNAISIAYTDGLNYYLGAYLQDTFLVTRKFTITPGIRWEFPETFTEKRDQLTVLLPNATDPLGARVGLPGLKGQIALVNSPAYSPRQVLTNRYDLFSPRINLAYTPNPSLSIRAGYGISWIPPDMVNYSLSPFQSSANAATTTAVTSVGGTSSLYPSATFGNPFPQGLVPPIGHNVALLPSVTEGQSVISPNPNNPFGYAQQWNLEVQQQLPGDFLLDLGYAGSKGTHLAFSTRQLNQLPDALLSQGTALNTQVANPFYGYIKNGTLSGATVARAQLLRPYPQFTGFSDTGGGQGDSHWDSLQTRLLKRFKSGSILSGSYTWSKLISNTDTLTSYLETHGAASIQDWNNLRGEKSLASFDVRNRIVVSYVLALPFGTQKQFFANAGPFFNRIVGGWSVNGITTVQSGFPLALSTSTNQTNSQGGGSRPNVVAANKRISGSAQSRINQWFNTSAFATPAAFTFGNESRVDSTLRSAGIANWDFTLSKAIPLTERISFDFKTETFNIFNRVQFGDPGTAVGSAAFGIVSTQVNNPRQIQFAGRLTF